MQGKLNVRCNGCGMLITTQIIDTASIDTDWQRAIEHINKSLLTHRKDCPFYGNEPN
jgi:hypothetical protein